ncbi:MAG: 2-isopropylmalate synthase [Clostridia bacterium]|nr:2-isopropylmalate synthase [Clostridia bacterium]
MDNDIYIFDTTLRDGEQSPGVSLNVHEKLEIAKQLEKLNVDVIEAGFPIASKGDFEAVKIISDNIRQPVICGLARAVKQDIDVAWEALKGAARPRIHTFIATSDLHLKYKLKMSRQEVIQKIDGMVRYAKGLCDDVEFSPEDASRTQPSFLCQVVETAIAAGASVINIPDTVGYSTPYEFGQLICYLKDNVKGIDNIILSVHCHNDLGMAVANSLSAVENGAQQVECAVNGLGERAGNAALEEIVMSLYTRKDYYNKNLTINTGQIYRTSKLISSLTGVAVQVNKAIVGANAFAHESGIHQHGVMSERSTYEIMTPESIGLKQNKMVLGKHSGRHAFEQRLSELGYVCLNENDINIAFKKFKDLADKKKIVLDEDIEALITEKVVEIPEVYVLDYFQVTSGNHTISTATVKLQKHQNIIEEAACGDGPIDAVFKAIERCLDREVRLVDYFIKAVTSGKDALGEVTVKVTRNSKIYIGRGLSTDIIEASANAYINAINKMELDASGE